MTHAYLYIEESGSCITAGSRFFKAYFGSGRLARHDLELVKNYAQEHGHYFKKWSPEVDTFFHKVNNSLNGVLPAILIGCDSVSLRLHLLRGKPLENPSHCVSNRKHLLLSISPEFFFLYNNRFPALAVHVNT